eukprot:EG_transcript_9625
MPSDTAADVQRLEAKMRQCAAAMQFEAAAALRDRIRALRRCPPAPTPSATAADEPKARTEGGRSEDIAWRTVVVSRVPLGTDEAQLKAQFPTATKIVPTTPSKKKHFRSFVEFQTAAEAEVVAAKQDIVVAGSTVKARILGRPPHAEPLRMVRVTCLPLGVADVHQHFPDACRRITLRKGKVHADALVEFYTAKAAKAAAARGSLKVDGQTAYIRLENVCAADHPTPVAPAAPVQAKVPKARMKEQPRKVCVTRLPLAMRNAEFKAHFPAAVSVRLQKGKCHSYGFALFKTEAEAEAVAAQGKLQLGTETYPVAMAGNKGGVHGAQKEEQRRCTVVLRRVPLGVSEADVQQCFPTAEGVNLLRGELSAIGFVRFATAEEAQAAAAPGHVTVAGHTVGLHTNGQKASEPKPERQKEEKKQNAEQSKEEKKEEEDGKTEKPKRQKRPLATAPEPAKRHKP